MRTFLVPIVLILSWIIPTNAQNSGVAFELHYPIIIPADANYVNDISGIIGGSISFQFTDNPVYNYGLKYTFDQLASRANSRYTTAVTELNFMTHHIDGFGTVNLNSTQTVKGVLEAGISFYKYRESTLQPSYFGYNVGPGINVEFHERFYAFASYHFIKTGLKDKQTEFIEKETMQAIRAGIGFKL